MPKPVRSTLKFAGRRVMNHPVAFGMGAAVVATAFGSAKQGLSHAMNPGTNTGFSGELQEAIFGYEDALGSIERSAARGIFIDDWNPDMNGEENGMDIGPTYLDPRAPLANKSRRMSGYGTPSYLGRRNIAGSKVGGNYGQGRSRSNPDGSMVFGMYNLRGMQ